jgi:tetratricopeptide (TPR) repeat protein
MKAIASRLARLFGAARPTASHEPPLEELKRATPGLHRLFPDDAQLLAALAEHLLGNGSPVRGRDCLDEARRLGLSEQHAATILARHHAVRGEFRQALEVLAGPLAQDAPTAQAHELAGVGFFHTRDIARAHRHYSEAVRLDPSNTMARASFAGVLYHCGRFEEAIAEANATLRYDPRSVTALKNLSVAFGALRRFDEEKGILELARAYHPDEPTSGCSTDSSNCAPATMPAAGRSMRIGSTTATKSRYGQAPPSVRVGGARNSTAGRYWFSPSRGPATTSWQRVSSAS